MLGSRGSGMMVPTSIERLDPFPAVAVNLLRRMPQPADLITELHRILESQPSLFRETVRVLVASGRHPDEGDPELVISQVGHGALLEIILTLLVREYMRNAFHASEDRRYWQYTLACAVCCEHVADDSQETRLLAYTAGLLHDIGRLALIATYPDRYSNLLSLTDRMFAANDPFDVLEHERLLFGMDHFATGAWLSAAWKFPPWLRAISGKFEDRPPAQYARLVDTVRTGTRLAHSVGFGYLQAAPRAKIRDILKGFPHNRDQAESRDDWNLVEEHVRQKVLARLHWYAPHPGSGAAKS